MHSEDTPPETCYKNNHRTPIDAIFVTPGIQPSQCGYMPYNAFMDSDHRALWLDVPFTSALGYNPPHLDHKMIKPVNSKDPRSVEKFAELAKKEMAKVNTSFLPEFRKL